MQSWLLEKTAAGTFRYTDSESLELFKIIHITGYLFNLISLMWEQYRKK